MKRPMFPALVAALLATLPLFGLVQPEREVQAVYAVAAAAAAPTPMLYSSASDAPDSQLQAIVEDVVGELPGKWGVAVKKLDTGQYASYNGDEQQVSASLYKMWVLNELYRQAMAGDLDLDGYETITGDDAYYDALLDDLRLPVGDSITLRRAAYLMITVSDNTAASLLVRTLGPDNINRFMRQNGLSKSRLDWSGVGDNLTTPLDVLREMEMVATSRMVDAEASRQMVEIMLDQQINNLLPPGLPDEARIAHKTGSLDALLHDAGIVYGPSGPYVIVAMASETGYAGIYENVPELSRRVYEYFNARTTSPARYFPQTRQTVGHDFLKFWNEYGGVKAFGYPIGPERMEGGVLVQPFERARMEWRPANRGAGAPHPEVGLGLIGQERAAQLRLSWPRSADTRQGKYFPETGQEITGGFYEYWLNNGGERVFGYPISPAANMVNTGDGKTYQTQWFQRARMELHPELPAGQRVVLGALGSELVR